MLKKKIFLALILTIIILNSVQSQQFSKEITQFKKQDSIAFPPKNSILFVGSSSFTKWKNISDSFPNHSIINRGFGGSTLLDIIAYKNEVIFAYNPKQIVIYCGENDMASSDSISGKNVLKRFKKLYKDIRQVYPKISIVFISMKPSPKRWPIRDRIIDGNHRINKFIQRQDNTKFVSVWDSMLDSKGLPNNSLFINDKLHLNKEGYAIWQKIIEPILLN